MPRQERSSRRSSREKTVRRSRDLSEQRDRNNARRESPEDQESREPRESRRAHRKAPRVNALDGLRSLAIVSVILYHLHIRWLPSGRMGVIMFLVLGGYLATCTVLRTIRREGSVSFFSLWVKRIARIWPSMATMIVVSVAGCALFNHVLLTKLRPDLVPSLLLANNLGAIMRGASYFDNLGGVSPLMHLWYLGIDMQLFLVWTLIVAFLCPRGRSTRIARRVSLALALASAILMLVLYDPNADPTRLYYGPDTMAFAPLLGGWLGLAWPLGGRPVRLDRARHTVRSIPLTIVSPVALVALIVIMVAVVDYSPFLYRGGMLLVAILTVLVMAGLLERRSIFSQIFSLKPLVWLGTRSFGLYLWHFPLFQLMGVNNNGTSPLVILASVALSLLLAEATLRFVERPLAQSTLPFGIEEAFAGLDDDPPMRYVRFVPSLVFCVVLATAAVGLIAVPDEYAIPQDALNNTGESAGQAMDMSQRDDRTSEDDASDEDSSSKKDTDEDKDSSKDADKDKKSSSQSPDDLPTGSITLRASKEDVKDGIYTPLIVADSVAGDASWYFEEHMPDALLDSVVGRRPDQALEVLKGYLRQNVVGDIVVLDSFSNVPATYDTLRELVEACGDRHVYIVNVRIPEVEQEQINESLEYIANEYDNATLIDWYSYSEGHEDWIYSDGEHLTPQGQPEYVDMISNAIAKDFAAEGGTVEAEE